MGKLRFIIALWAAKLAKPVLHLFGRNATNFPGKVAISLCPDFLSRIEMPKRIIAVTGTNGKTTVCNLLCSTLEQMGERVLSNRAGGNIASGIATTLAGSSTLTGKCRYGLGVFEIDERSAIKLFRDIKPEILAVTNLTRDSIMRNAHPAYIADILTRGIPAGTRLVLNGDDLIGCRVAPDNERVYFGIEAMPTDTIECVNRVNDLRVCPVCAGELKYEYRRYNHIGKAVCTGCGFGTPEYDYAAGNVDTESMKIRISEHGGECVYPLLSDSVFNIYNVVNLVAVLREMGYESARIAEAMSRVELPPSRFNAVTGGGITAIMHMSKDKNASACSRVFDDIKRRAGKKEIVIMINCLEDEIRWSENCCWMYDADFEFLADDSITRIVATGPRYRDHYLRLLLAGVPEERIRETRTETDAPDLLALEPDESVYILYGTDGIDLARQVQTKALKLAGERNGDK